MSLATLQRIALAQAQRALERAYAELCMEDKTARFNEELLAGVLDTDHLIRMEMQYL